MTDFEDKVEMQDVRLQIESWQRKQFPDATLDGAGRHLLKEINEACEELGDVFFLAVQCEELGGLPIGLPEMCWRTISEFGLVPEQVILAKLAKNKERKWPEKPAADGCYHHEADND